MKHMKKIHIYRIKVFYSRINKLNDYMKQILTYNIRNVNLYVINIMLKREKMLKTNNLLFKKNLLFRISRMQLISLNEIKNFYDK